ncbi:MAG: methyltransferase domain-containing protein [Proteobacteria bacterium]|nr:methyltransferase domain-containing protein [Pseudomonadota bacterium]
MTTLPDGPNQGQAQYWNADNGAIWVRLQPVLDAMFQPIADEVVRLGFPGEGGRVLDIGCGAGGVTLAMARQVGPAGGCLGVDISAPLVEAATARAKAEGLASARFALGDAQTFAFEAAAFDAAVSRFGVMFFDDPAAAFGNIRRAVRPGGRLAFAAWRGPDENPFMTTGARIARTFNPDLRRYEPDAPGQFGLAREARILEVLSAAGWSDIETQAWDAPGVLPESQLASFVTQVGATGETFRMLPEAQRAEAAQAIVAAYAPFVREGAARFDMACWLVTAKA